MYFWAEYSIKEKAPLKEKLAQHQEELSRLEKSLSEISELLEDVPSNEPTYYKNTSSGTFDEKAFLNNITAMQAAEKHKKEQKDRVKSIIKGAAVGGVIAGPEGAVIGAMIQAEKNKK